MTMESTLTSERARPLRESLAALWQPAVVLYGTDSFPGLTLFRGWRWRSAVVANSEQLRREGYGDLATMLAGRFGLRAGLDVPQTHPPAAEAEVDFRSRRVLFDSDLRQGGEYCSVREGRFGWIQ